MMRPPRGITISKGHREGDHYVVDVTVARWRLWLGLPRALWLLARSRRVSP